MAKHASLQRAGIQERVSEIKAKFRDLDTSGDGLLDFDELRSILQHADMTDRQVRTLYNRVDRNHDGKISFDEFVDYVFSSELSQARHRMQKSSRLNRWDGPEYLKVNGSWDSETIMAFQRFLHAQATPTARAVSADRFTSGKFGAATIISLQELLLELEVPTALEHSKGFTSGQFDETTIVALHELLAGEGVPTASQLGDNFIKGQFRQVTVFAIQELMVAMRKTRGPGLQALR